VTNLDEADQSRRKVAAELFNETWRLIEWPGRTPEQDRRMLITACASWLEWDAIGTEENRAVADWQIAHVASLLGYGDLALAHATAAFERTEGGQLPSWLRASTLEGLARAHAAAGHKAERDAYVERATAALRDLDDPEDRDLIASQLATVPEL
jgi:hypothetical protein